jgi:hypothetical protein
MAEDDVTGRGAEKDRPAVVAGGDAAGGDSGIRALFAELFGALRDAGEAMLDAHKRLAAEQTAEVAGAVQRFGRSVDQTQSRLIDRNCYRAATHIAAAATAMRERRWGEIAADAEAFAQRRPAMFLLAALGGGFAVGRLLMVAAERERRKAASAPGAAATPPVASPAAATPVEPVL